MFHKLFKITMMFEGVDSDHPDDSGGRTRFGITTATALRHGIAITDLTIKDTENIMFEDYYKANKIGVLADTEIHAFMFDWVVNSGPRAVKLMQTAIGTKDDGDIGPKTLKAAKKTGALRKVQIARLEDLHRICRDKPKQKAFLVGWTRRVVDPVWDENNAE